MSRARVLFIGLTLVSLTACGSSEVVDDHYYSLVLAAGVPADDVEDVAAHLVVGPIELPRYLSGRGLSMQVGPNRIESASHHFWAEPLDEAIAKVLARDIDERTDGIEVERESGRWTGDAECRVRIEFDAFHPTYQSQVLVSGRYWIVSGDANERRDFSLSRRLTTDGYANAVDELRDALQALADQIAGDIRSAPTCGDDAAASVAADQT